MNYAKNIKYHECNINFYTNDFNLLNNIMDEYDCILEFTELKTKENSNINLIAINSKKMYNKYFERSKKHTLNNEKVYIDIRRENIIFISRKERKIFLVYNELNYERIQYIEEILLGIYEIELRDLDYFYLNAACITKNANAAIALVSKNKNYKDKLLLKLLYNAYNYVCNSKLAIKETSNNIVNAISIPRRMGIERVLLKELNLEEKKIKRLESTEGYKNEIKESSSNRKVEKFNLNINEISDIFGANIITKIKLKVVFEIHYIKDIETLKTVLVGDNEKREILLKNLIDVPYKYMDYMKWLYDEKKSKKYNYNMKNITVLKVYMNENLEGEFLKLVSSFIG